MRKLTLTFALLLTGVLWGQQPVPSPAQSAAILSWGASPTPGVMVYTLYQGISSGVYSTSINCGTNLSWSVSNLVRGTTYYFAVTATDTNSLTSPYSNEASTTAAVIPMPPGDLQITIKINL